MISPPDFTHVFGGSVAAGPVDLHRWQRMEAGGGALVATETGLRLTTTGTSAQRYSNAQIDDYQGRSRRDFLWRPPLTLTLRARFSHPAMLAGTGAGLRGTAGFGFWNDPFLMTGPGLPALPRAIWFFYASPPSDIKLDRCTPGFGWKAATIDALHPSAAALALAAPLAIPLMNIRSVYDSAWPAFQRVLRVCETPVTSDMTGWHTYVIEWGVRRARFSVDDATVLDCDTPPRGPLGLVIWLDNQYLVATPWGRLRHGLLAVPEQQWLELEWVEIVTQRVNGPRR